jgi:MFS family permease
MILFPLANGPWLFAIAIVIYGLASSIAGVVPSVIMSASVPRHQSGFVVGVTRTAGDVGAVVGPLAVFALYGRFGEWAPVGAIAAVLVISAALLVRVAVRSRPNVPVGQPA